MHRTCPLCLSKAGGVRDSSSGKVTKKKATSFGGTWMDNTQTEEAIADRRGEGHAYFVMVTGLGITKGPIKSIVGKGV